MNHSRVIVALDYADAGAALAMVDALDPAACALKIGKELFTAAGPDLVRECAARGFRVFLDLKFHDIPNTVAGACAAATRLGVWMLNVHAAGGAAMMRAASDAVARVAAGIGQPPPLLIGVTVLTSLDEAALRATGVADSPASQVLRLAQLAKASGLSGVVASAHEAAALRSALGPDFRLVIPGIRPADAAVDDQSRIATPEIAIARGADYLVIGRPITQSRDPADALRAIRRSLGEIN